MRKLLQELKQIDIILDAALMLRSYFITLLAVKLISLPIGYIFESFTPEGYELICIGLVLANVVEIIRVKALRLAHVVSLTYVLVFYLLISNGLCERWIFI